MNLTRGYGNDSKPICYITQTDIWLWGSKSLSQLPGKLCLGQLSNLGFVLAPGEDHRTLMLQCRYRCNCVFHIWQLDMATRANIHAIHIATVKDIGHASLGSLDNFAEEVGRKGLMRTTLWHSANFAWVMAQTYGMHLVQKLAQVVCLHIL